MDDNDDFDWQWQRLSLESKLASIDGDAFETLFQTIAKRLWKTDFTPTIPMGRRGDLKCDGFRSDGAVFQCYGPRYGQANVNEALAKIGEDFDGAVQHWGDALKKWYFVVGLYRDKVPSEIVRSVATKAQDYSVETGILTRNDILDLASQLSPLDRAKLFGRAPRRGDVVRAATYVNIGRALAHIRGQSWATPFSEIQLPPTVERKIDFNSLPHSARHFLGIGQLGADRVRQYLVDKVEPLEAERMANGFKERYIDLRAAGEEPSATFQQLLTFAGGATGDMDRQAAALAVVTHFFSTCEIFERPPEEES